MEGHQDLERDKNILGISAWSQSQLMPGFPKSWRIQRQSNVASLAQNLKALGCHPDTVCHWTHDQTPMAYVLKLADTSQRDRVRQHLIQHQIFPPIHWLSQDTPDADAKELGNRVLSIPIDQRYQASDMSRVAEVLRSALHN